MSNTRPSNKEIVSKVKLAMDDLKANKFMFGTTKHLAGDLDAIGLETTKDLPSLLIELLEEINAVGPLGCYAGTRPPQRSYEPEIKNLELWAYAWSSPLLNKAMYIKFALKAGHYVYVDCHEDRPTKG
jgi:hypothetical protein